MTSLIVSAISFLLAALVAWSQIRVQEMRKKLATSLIVRKVDEVQERDRHSKRQLAKVLLLLGRLDWTVDGLPANWRKQLQK